jgi:hypothetical protein
VKHLGWKFRKNKILKSVFPTFQHFFYCRPLGQPASAGSTSAIGRYDDFSAYEDQVDSPTTPTLFSSRANVIKKFQLSQIILLSDMYTEKRFARNCVMNPFIVRYSLISENQWKVSNCEHFRGSAN